MSEIGVAQNSGTKRIDAKEAINKLEGKTVTVAVSLDGVRASFGTQISIMGKLEKHPDLDEYRVMVDDSTYTYFGSKDAIGIVHISTGPCIFLRIDTTLEI